MLGVQKLESEIRQLPGDQQWELLSRFSSRLWDEWDHQIASDAAAGRLGHLMKEARSEIENRSTRPMDEVVGDL